MSHKPFIGDRKLRHLCFFLLEVAQEPEKMHNRCVRNAHYSILFINLGI